MMLIPLLYHVKTLGRVCFHLESYCINYIKDYFENRDVLRLANSLFHGYHKRPVTALLSVESPICLQTNPTEQNSVLQIVIIASHRSRLYFRIKTNAKVSIFTVTHSTIVLLYPILPYSHPSYRNPLPHLSLFHIRHVLVHVCRHLFHLYFLYY